MNGKAEISFLPHGHTKCGRKRQKSFQIHIYSSYCKGCGICSEMCPAGALQISTELGPLGYFVAEVADADLCNGCCYCERACPDLAITVLEHL